MKTTCQFSKFVINKIAVVNILQKAIMALQNGDSGMLQICTFDKSGSVSEFEAKNQKTNMPGKTCHCCEIGENLSNLQKSRYPAKLAAPSSPSAGAGGLGGHRALERGQFRFW